MHSPSFRSLLAALLALSTVGSSAFADTFYWGGISDNVSNKANWFTDAAGNIPSDPAPNSLSHDLIFNTTDENIAGSTVTIDTSFSAKSLTFNTSGVTTLSQSVNRDILLGSGGISMAAGSGAVNFGVSTAPSTTLTTRIAASQTWINNATNSASRLTVRNLTTNTGSGNVSLTLNAANAGDIFFTFNINDSVNDQLALVIDSAGAGFVTLNGTSNGYRGGTTIKSGTLNTFGTLGSGDVMLGDITGSSNASLNVRIAAFTNSITVRSGSTGTKTITTNSGAITLSNSLTLNDNLTINNTTAGTFSGSISGTGDIVKTGTAALTFSGANTSQGDLTINTGAFTLAEAGSLTFYIKADGVTNQVNGTTTGTVTFNGTFNLNLSGASLIDGNSWTLVSLSNESYGGTFSLAGFTEVNNVWTRADGFTFTESDGILTYSAVPEPSTFALLGGFGALLFASARRRNLRA